MTREQREDLWRAIEAYVTGIVTNTRARTLSGLIDCQELGDRIERAVRRIEFHGKQTCIRCQTLVETGTYGGD